MGGEIESVLLVEGQNDFHLIRNLCNAHKIIVNNKDKFTVGEPFYIDYQTDIGSGYQRILNGLPVRLIRKPIKLGIVIDADTDCLGRWKEICNTLKLLNYIGLPEQPTPDGCIVDFNNKQTIGIWLMPNNQTTGMLEDFAINNLIPQDDTLIHVIRTHIDQVESNNMHRYNATLHRSKATIHSWLSYQEDPGSPMGQAITKKYFSHDQIGALVFIEWIKRLFNI